MRRFRDFDSQRPPRAVLGPFTPVLEKGRASLENHQDRAHHPPYPSVIENQ